MQMPSLIQHSATPPSGELCAACGRVIGELEQPFIWEQNIVCFGCHRDLSQAPVSDGGELSDRALERVFLSDSRLQVSRTQVVVDAAGYAVSDIRLARLTKATPRRAFPIGAAAVGLVTAIFGLNRHLDSLDLTILFGGAAVFVGGIALAIARRTRYSVLINVNGSEICLLTTTRGKYAQTLVDAIGEAVIERGQFMSEPPPAQLGLTPAMRAQLRR